MELKLAMLCVLSSTFCIGSNLANQGPKDTGQNQGVHRPPDGDDGAEKGNHDSHSQRWAKRYQEAWEHLKSMSEQNDTFALLLENHLLLYNQEPQPQKVGEERADKTFTCSLPPSASNPDNAHSVRPGDINAVAAIGDSITAGYGITATNYFQILRNDRHQAWSSGGILSLEEGVVTTPNILRKFSSRVSGFSWDESSAGDVEAGLNVAVGGAVSEQMYDQAVHLTELMYTEGPKMGVDWEHDWKLVNFLIGGNDLCSYCGDSDAYSPDVYAQNVIRAIDYLYSDGPPKMIITVNTVFDITRLPAFSDGVVCDIIQWSVCACATSSSNHAMLQTAQREYHDRLEEVVASGRWDRPARPDFTVVFIPHLQHAQPPMTESGEADRSFWAIDCFHPGRKAHQVLAVSLWNQMFVDQANKRRDVDWTLSPDDIFCPTEEEPFIKTRLNSGSSLRAKGENQNAWTV